MKTYASERPIRLVGSDGAYLTGFDGALLIAGVPDTSWRLELPGIPATPFMKAQLGEDSTEWRRELPGVPPSPVMTEEGI